MTRQTFAEQLALRMLANEKLTAIWNLHLAAARAYHNGNGSVAVILTEIAEAAEREWMRRCAVEAGDL
jgi:hypothetical protein